MMRFLLAALGIVLFATLAVPSAVSGGSKPVLPGVMAVTGYEKITPAGGAREPVTVRAGLKASGEIWAALRKLSIGPKTQCMESVNVVSISFVLRGNTQPRYTVTFNPCGPPGYVEVAVAGRSVGDFEVDCAFKKAVLAVFSRGQAKDTRLNLKAGCP